MRWHDPRIAIACDECGAGLCDPAFPRPVDVVLPLSTIFPEKTIADRVASEHGWIRTQSGKHICGDCFE